ncbi:MAG: hypothetical protein GTO53_13265 [Planctomycetales bacterium]|nr:hypothetical protein [Planctomycetales bacterium]NIM10064.1 hypothetical protein [Planctomycetales bacterium]NIN09505.1 hypothetical protein [Planctomycetales bacterium]NIN78616.1 hypothetical protein [Planctomycetales bacterium]NIO35810.1 hypothetical protein [Planctomycetales bacterium]
MNDWLVFAEVYRLWYSLPLIVTVSLVYAATRHEDLGPILKHATRTIVWILAFMVIVFVILYVLSERL